jgi:hypothetical protein
VGGLWAGVALYVRTAEMRADDAFPLAESQVGMNRRQRVRGRLSEGRLHIPRRA